MTGFYMKLKQLHCFLSRSSHMRCSVKNDALKNFANWSATVLKRDFNKVFSYKICEIFKNTYYCRFSYAGTWELVNLFVGTKNFSYHICYENIDGKYNKILRSQETDSPWRTDRTEQYASKEECIK